MRILNDDGHVMTNPTDKTNILYISLAFCTLSVFMSLLILVFYALYSSFRKNFASQLIVTISLMDLISWGVLIISSIFSLTHDMKTYEEYSHPICVLNGFLFSFLNLVVFFSVLIIGYSLFSEFIYSYDISQKRHTMFAFIFISSFILSIIPLFNDEYGKVDDVKCWIVNYWERIFLFYVPLWLITIIDFVLMLKVIRKLQGINVQDNMKRKLILKFALFPILMFVSWAPSSVKRVWDVDNMILEGIMYAMMPMQGVFNPLAYGLINSDVKEKILAFLLCQWKDLGKKKDDIENRMYNPYSPENAETDSKSSVN